MRCARSAGSSTPWRRAAVGEAVVERSGLDRSAVRLLQLKALVSTVATFAGSLFAGSALGTVLVGRLAEEARYPLIFTLGAVAAVPLGLVGAVGRVRWRGPDREDDG